VVNPIRYEKAEDQVPSLSGPSAAWGLSTRYIEVGEDYHAIRHVDAFVSGKYLRYDRVHWVDGFGMLADGILRTEPEDDPQFVVHTTTKREFEKVWQAAGDSVEWQQQVATAQMKGWSASPPWLARALRKKPKVNRRRRR
jgi:hypothetical protein